MDFPSLEQQQAWAALERLLRLARGDTGQARRVANFLLAWHNAEENGGWDPVDLWNVDDAIAEDMLTVARLVKESGRYPADLGFEDEIKAVWRAWRGSKIYGAETPMTGELVPSRARLELPALIAAAGEPAGRRFLEFFTVNTRNPNTRAAYARAAGAFLSWCETRGRGIALGEIQPVHVAAYIEELQRTRSAPTVKQHLACLRMLFDWLVIGQVVPSNPAHAVRGPRHSVSKGSTPVLSSEEARELLQGMNVSSVVGLRDRALIAVMTYSFARVGAVVRLTVEDYFPQKKRWWLRLREKNGKVNEMPCHHKLEAYLDEYIKTAGIREDRKGPLFRAAIGKTKKLGPGAMARTDVWYMVQRRAADAGIETALGCHTFRATGITDYLTNGGRIEVAQRMAGHSNAKTTGLYDRRNDDISVGEVERIGI